MKVILVDDEKSMLLIMKKMLSKIPGIEVAGIFQNAGDAFGFISAEHGVDMAFLDISMPGESGLELAQRIPSVNSGMDVVFLTSHKEYALDAFDVHAFDYLVKPVSQERLERTVQRAVDKRKHVSVNIPGNRSSKMSVYCFGGMDLRGRDGAVVRWISVKCGELFAYLLLNRGRLVSREMIMEEIFRGMPPKNAGTYLNTTIYQLKKTLEPHGMKPVILSNGGSYGIDSRDMYIDFIDFEDRINNLTMIDESNQEEAVSLEKLYAGDLFGDRAYLWALPERERLSELYARLVKKLGKYLVEINNLSFAARILKKLVNRNELDEEANCLLMQVYAAQRDKHSLVAHFERYSKFLQKELGVNPGSSVVNLFVALRKAFE